jgi:hypothetical protein
MRFGTRLKYRRAYRFRAGQMVMSAPQTRRIPESSPLGECALTKTLSFSGSGRLVDMPARRRASG